jgi:TonB family protein
LAKNKILRALPVLAASVMGMASAALAGDAPPAYVKTCLIQIIGHVTYPKMAKVRNQEGVVVLAVTIDGAGAPSSIAVETSSGVQSLDDAAVDAAKAVGNFPPPPEGPTVVHGKVNFSLGG